MSSDPQPTSAPASASAPPPTPTVDSVANALIDLNLNSPRPTPPAAAPPTSADLQTIAHAAVSAAIAAAQAATPNQLFIASDHHRPRTLNLKDSGLEKFDPTARDANIDRWAAKFQVACTRDGLDPNSNAALAGAVLALCPAAQDHIWNAFGLGWPDTGRRATFADLVHQLKAMAGHVNPMVNAWIAINNLRMRSRNDLPSYISTYRRYDALIPADYRAENDRMLFFIHGLTPDIRHHVTLQKPKTLNEAITYATSVATNYRLSTALSSTAAVSSSSSSYIPHSASTSDPSFDPMDTSASIRLPLPRDVKCVGVPKHIRDQRQANRQCMQCGSDSHSKTRCPQLAALLSRDRRSRSASRDRSSNTHRSSSRDSRSSNRFAALSDDRQHNRSRSPSRDRNDRPRRSDSPHPKTHDGKTFRSSSRDRNGDRRGRSPRRT